MTTTKSPNKDPEREKADAKAGIEQAPGDTRTNVYGSPASDVVKGSDKEELPKDAPPGYSSTPRDARTAVQMNRARGVRLLGEGAGTTRSGVTRKELEREARDIHQSGGGRPEKLLAEHPGYKAAAKERSVPRDVFGRGEAATLAAMLVRKGVIEEDEFFRFMSEDLKLDDVLSDRMREYFTSLKGEPKKEKVRKLG